MSVLQFVSDLLAEPGYRQLVVGGASAFLGAVTRFAHEMTDTSRGRESGNPLANELVPPGVSIGIPTAVALEEAIRHTPVMENYVIETTADLASAGIGYKVGNAIGERLAYAYDTIRGNR